MEASIEEIADAVLAATGKPQSLKEIVPDRPSHDRRYLLDSSKIRTGAGLGADGPVRAGPGRHGRLVRRPPGWWEPLRDRAPVVEGAWAGPGRRRR